MGELGRSPRERPSLESEATRKAMEAGGEAIAEEMTGETGGVPALAGEVTMVRAGDPSIVLGCTAAEIFRETSGVVEAILREIAREARCTGGIRRTNDIN